jgi:hypothetical protein
VNRKRLALYQMLQAQLPHHGLRRLPLAILKAMWLKYRAGVPWFSELVLVVAQLL